MAEHPKKPFSLATKPEKDLENIRDKDNAQPQAKPAWAQKPRPNLAPSGMSGIKRGLRSPAPPKPDKEPSHADDLTITFTPLVRPQEGKERDIDR